MEKIIKAGSNSRVPDIAKQVLEAVAQGQTPCILARGKSACGVAVQAMALAQKRLAKDGRGAVFTIYPDTKIIYPDEQINNANARGKPRIIYGIKARVISSQRK